MSTTLLSLLIVESVLTAAAVVMFLYRGMLDLKEEDHIILNDAESHLAREQQSIRNRLTTLTKYLKVVGVAWSVLAVAIFSMWIAVGLDLL